MPWLYGLGLLVLAAAIVWLWQNPPQPAAVPDRIAALAQQIEQVQRRLSSLEQRPASQPVDLRPLEQRIAALEQRQPAAPPDLGPLEQRIAAMEQRQAAAPPDLGPLEQRIAALEQKMREAPEAVSRTDLTALAARVDQIAGRQDALANRQQGMDAAIGNRLDANENRVIAAERAIAALPDQAKQIAAIDQRLAAVEKSAEKIAGLAERTAKLGRIQAAQAALEAGRSLGSLPEAPPALARFADSRPPTEAALRLAFPATARAAEAASQPAAEGQPLLDRMWTRAQGLVTVRQGDNVIVGDPAAGVIARARESLDAGDLAGAVTALEFLSGAPAQAVSDWLGKAKSLLAARAALADMASRA